MKEKISRNKISSHYKSFFELDNMALAENDNLMIDWGESLINELVNQEVGKRIAERMSDDEIKSTAYRFAPIMLYPGITCMEDVNLSIRQDIIEMLMLLRFRLTNDSQKMEHTHQVAPQVPLKMEGGGE